MTVDFEMHGIVPFEWDATMGDYKEQCHHELLLSMGIPIDRKRSRSPYHAPFDDWNATLCEQCSSQLEKNINMARVAGQRNALIIWDVENLRAPRGMDYGRVAMALRERLTYGLNEVGFYVACDWPREQPNMIQQLSEAGVTILRSSNNVSDSADRVLMTQMNHVGSCMDEGDSVILITQDVGFSYTCWAIREQLGLRVVIVHGKQDSTELKYSGVQLHCFDDIIQDVPINYWLQNRNSPVQQRPALLPTPTIDDMTNRGSLHYHAYTDDLCMMSNHIWVIEKCLKDNNGDDVIRRALLELLRHNVSFGNVYHVLDITHRYGRLDHRYSLGSAADALGTILQAARCSTMKIDVADLSTLFVHFHQRTIKLVRALAGQTYVGRNLLAMLCSKAAKMRLELLLQWRKGASIESYLTRMFDVENALILEEYKRQYCGTCEKSVLGAVPIR